MINKELLYALLRAASPSGYEGSASNVFADHMNKFATLVKRDNAGNTIYRMGNPEASVKLMLSAHIDEIALQIQNIDDKGFLHFVADGGIDKKVLPGSHVKVLTSTGIIDVIFTSGSSPTVLTITPPTGMTMKWANNFDPTILEANATYEINIMDGYLVVVAKWT